MLQSHRNFQVQCEAHTAYSILHWTCLSSITMLLIYASCDTTHKQQTNEKKRKKTVSMMLLCKLPQKKWRTYIEHTSTYERFFSFVCCVHCGKKIRCDILFSWMQLKYAKLAVRKNFFCQSRRWEIAAKRKAWTRVGEIDDTFIFLHSTKFSVGIPYWLLFIHVSWQFQLKRCVCHICWILFVKCVFEYE